MKYVAVFLISILSMTAKAGLRLDCSTLTPKELLIFKAQPKADPCIEKGVALVALTSSGVLHVCDDSKTIERFDISIGRAGVGKTREGDLKTPLGVYTLGSPKRSERFGLFIPVGYPTRQQRGQGLTGSDVGIHGPDRTFACAGVLNVSFNWTQGCMAVADDRFIVQIAEFVKAHPGLRLHSLE
jgi:murein L,D-transpeptidase YafK